MSTDTPQTARRGIKVGEVYRHRDHPSHGYAKVIEIIPAKFGVNTHGYKIVKVEWALDRAFRSGMIKHFKQSDLIPMESQNANT